MEGDSDEYDVAEVDFMDDDNLIVSGIKLTATRNPPRSSRVWVPSPAVVSHRRATFSFTMAVGRALMTAIWRVKYI